MMRVVAAQHFRVAAILLSAAVGCCPRPAPADQTQGEAYVAVDGLRVDQRTYAGWRAIRQFDCARCHGAHYQESVGPSLIAAARTNSEAGFIRLLLNGNPDRGMPPYRDIPGVAHNASGIYGYFKGRADGNIQDGVLQPLP